MEYLQLHTDLTRLSMQMLDQGVILPPSKGYTFGTLLSHAPTMMEKLVELCGGHRLMGSRTLEIGGAPGYLKMYFKALGLPLDVWDMESYHIGRAAQERYGHLDLTPRDLFNPVDDVLGLYDFTISSLFLDQVRHPESPDPDDRPLPGTLATAVKAIQQLALVTKVGGWSLHSVQISLDFDEAHLADIQNAGFRLVSPPGSRLIVLYRDPELAAHAQRLQSAA